MPVPDPAATVIVMRRSGHPFEILMVERNARGFFGRLVVFPGGRVDAIDVPSGSTVEDDISHRRAAMRELAEEAGFVITEGGTLGAVGKKGSDYYDWLNDLRLIPSLHRLELISRWVTPETAPRRFDTRFYLVDGDDVPDIRLDTDELVDHAWVTPEQALARYENGDWPMFLPTLAHLRWLSRRASAEEAMAAAAGADGRTRILPQRMDDGSIVPIMMPGR